MQQRRQKNANCKKMVPIMRKKRARKKKTDNTGTCRVQKVCADKTIRRKLKRGKLETKFGNRFGRRQDEKQIFNRRKSERGGHHINHRVNRLVKLRISQHKYPYCPIFKILLHKRNTEKNQERKSGNGKRRLEECHKPGKTTSPFRRLGRT